MPNTEKSQIAVSGRHMDLGESLTSHAVERMQEITDKYFGRVVGCTVVFSKQKLQFCCDISIQMGRDMYYNSNAEHENVYTCFNNAAERLAKQLRREKRALREDKAPRVDRRDEVLMANSVIDGDDGETVIYNIPELYNKAAE